MGSVMSREMIMREYLERVKHMEAAPGKYLDYSFNTITAIYESHNNVLNAKWRGEAEHRENNQMKRQERQRYLESERHRLKKKELRIPGHLASERCNFV